MLSVVEVRQRLSRMDVNQLFCGRSGLAFEYKIESGSLSSHVQTLDKLTDPTPTILSPRQIIGVGVLRLLIFLLDEPDFNPIEHW